MIQSTVNLKSCTGCGACKNACPVNAISMQYSDDGFYIPVINKDICISCGKCKKVCHAINFKFKNSNKPVCIAFAANDEERKNSTSGALFPVLAKYVFNKGGYVAGVAWNKDFEAEHIIIDNEKDLYKLRYSKYVQASTGDSFKQIKELLENDKYVLFSGTPCQVAGLYNFLNKDYEKLITLDLICHGTPSPKVWQDYLVENFDKDKITNINFRKQDKGWVRGTLLHSSSSIDCTDGSQTPINGYFHAFLNGTINNEPCLECKYRSIPRPADFTGGDFWYLHKSELDDKKGLSICLLNNEKANKIFDEIKEHTKFYKEIDLEDDYTKIELYTKTRRNREREIFFKKYKEGKISTTKLLNASVNKHYDIGFLSFFNGLNYGSALVAYAVNSILENLGYSVLNIHKKRGTAYSFDKYHKTYQFALKNYFMTKELSFEDDHRTINDCCENFVLGSDTLWWWSDVLYTNNFYWLDFVTSNKRKISFCTSFGFDEPKLPESKIQEIKYLYKRFNSLSVREESGVKILKDCFDCDGVHLWDPVLVVNPEIFFNLALQSERNDKDYIFAYILDLDDEKQNIINNVAKKLGLKLILIPKMHSQYQIDKEQGTQVNVDIEDFVYLIKNAKYVITDSFHGACFSVIFRKQFAAYLNKERGNARYKIFDEMNLKNRFINSYDELYNFDFNSDIDFLIAKETINKHSKQAITWLKDALNKQIGKVSDIDLMYDVFCIEKQRQIETSKNLEKNFEKKLKQQEKMLIKQQENLAALKETNRINKIIYEGHNAKKLYKKYRFLVNFVFGKTKKRYFEKKNLYKKRFELYEELENKNWRK